MCMIYSCNKIDHSNGIMIDYHFFNWLKRSNIHCFSYFQRFEIKKKIVLGLRFLIEERPYKTFVPTLFLSKLDFYRINR